LNVTDPAGVPEVVDITVAVNVTVWPCFEGFSEEATDVLLAALVIVSVKAVETLGRKFTLPP
jgi:hypothetical protein